MVPRRHYFILLLITFSCLDLRGQIFSWKNPNFPSDSTRADSVLAAKLNRDVFLRDTANFVRSAAPVIVDEAVLVRQDRAKILGDLDAKGAIVRGVSFGNSQGSSVQSSMDMQVSGRLSKDVAVLASISDHNLPMQADGYTQTLDEFDKIYLQLNIKNSSVLRAGHLDINDNQTYFGRYQRRSMGLEFQTEWGKSSKTFADISLGVARSEFHRIRFQAIEGNQGPYRLTGRNGENFITIISGSEQVYIDGVLMRRGENLDYVINYNTGEVSFTSFRPVYRQNFITISYNYTNRNFSRYLVTGNIRHQSEKARFGLSWFSENDNKNAPISLNLSKEDEQILAAAGNDPGRMYAPSGEEAAYDVNKILYRRLYDASGQFHYEFSTDPAEKLYQVTFSFAGDSKGDYRLTQSSNNGRVFQYAGAGNGDYAALRKLPAPQKSQVISGNAEFLLNEGKIGADASLSNYDPNLFSSRDSKENTGYAARIYAGKTFRKGGWAGTPALEYQHISGRFHILDRINNVEFSRDFNLPQEFSQITQNRLIFSFINLWKGGSFINYHLNLLNEEKNYQGLKNDLEFGFNKGKIRTAGQFSYLNTSGNALESRFVRGSVLSEYLGKKGSWGLGAGLEHNVRKYGAERRADAASYSWKELYLQRKIGDSARTKLFAKLYFRDNDSVRGAAMAKVNHLLGLAAESQIIRNERTQLGAQLHYRKFFYRGGQDLPQQNSDFVIGNIVYTQQLFQNGMRLQAFYELGNGQEAQREFQYLKVADGQGVYSWTDYNGDGVQQLDEFEVAKYADQARFIRIYTNSIRYLPSNKNKLQLALFVNPAVVFSSGNRFLKRWNFNVSVLSQNSYLKGKDVLAPNPFEKKDGQILKNQSLLAAAQFNPADGSGWNGIYRFTASDNLVNANFSNEESRRSVHFLNLGYWFSKDLRLDFENSYQHGASSSQLFPSRNYLLESAETKPKATYRLSSALQAELFAALRNRLRTDGEERLHAYELSGTLQWNFSKTSLRGGFSFINNNFTGNSFSIVANQMLEGLKAGKNEVWNVYLQRAVGSFINLNISYEGRNSADRVIHTGSMQIKASF